MGLKEKDLKTTIEMQGVKAKEASKELNVISTMQKDEALNIIAEELEKEAPSILKENQADLEAGKVKGFDQAYMDRLKLTEERIAEFAQGLREVASLEDPTDQVISQWTLENGLDVSKVTVPLGVLGMIYEARPNVTVDATGLALKSGNAIILKGGSSAIHSNSAIVKVIHQALEKTAIPTDAVQFIESTNRKTTQKLFTMKEYVDVLIPRGGGALIKAVVENATVPVLETGVGNCHLYIDREADLEKALKIIVNAKTDRPAVCNAAETLIIHEEWFKKHYLELDRIFKQHSIKVHGDSTVIDYFADALPADESDWANEYLSLEIAVKVVESQKEAIQHIEKYGTKHSEAIITESDEAAVSFMKRVDAAAVYHNASTRFTDGGALGFGAEIGISTQKLHARGPMGLPALTTVKYQMRGTGQIRQ